MQGRCSVHEKEPCNISHPDCANKSETCMKMPILIMVHLYFHFNSSAIFKAFSRFFHSKN